jgi:uncharacterized membrane protein
MPLFRLVAAGMGGIILSLASWVFLIAGLIFLIIRVVRSGKRTGFPEATLHAYDSLVTRYVRGEITREQFEQMKHDVL